MLSDETAKNFAYSPTEEILETAKEDEVFTGVLETEKTFVRNHKEMLEYEARERYERDMATIRADGIADGEAKGKAEGIVEGEAKGRAEGKLEALLATAKEMQAGGLNIEQVKKFTKLTDKELSNLL